MAHAEKCPVCEGSGRVWPFLTSSTGDTVVCHGCCGKGWVQLNEFPMPIRLDPTVPEGMIRFESNGRIVGEVTVTHDGITHPI